MAGQENSSSALISLDIVKQLMKVQEDSFKSFVNLLLVNFNSRFDNLSREVQEIKSSLTYSQQDIDDVQSKLENVDELSDKMTSIQVDISELADSHDYVENQSRRNNIRIDGLPEEKNENWDSTEAKVKDLMKSKLKIDPTTVEIERAHRTGKSTPTARPRQIVVKLLRYKDKEATLKSSKLLKDTGIFINEDFSTRVMQRRKEQQEALKKARREGKFAYFNVDRLIIKNRRVPHETDQGASASPHSNQNAPDEQDPSRSSSQSLVFSARSSLQANIKSS